MAVERMLVAGRYRLGEPVGAGGMGRVWRARDEMLDRDVAVKEFVPPEWMSDEERVRLRDRTLREARSAGRLNHPHVVRIYDVVHADGLPWIVMEYVPSRSLYQVIQDDGPYSPATTARIGLAVLDALTAAHRAGVLHRDVKPHNVLIGHDGRVVLTDFGLATFMDDGSVTGPGLIVGSPQYVSPERARDGTSTPESDLWSLGATLYTAVEGRSPYARENAMATLMALATEEPDPPVRAGMLGPVLTGLLRHEPRERLSAPEVERRLRMIISATPSPVRAGVPSPRRARAVVGSDIDQIMAPARASVAALPPPPAEPLIVARKPKTEPPPRSTLMAAGLALVTVLGIGGIMAGYLVQRDEEKAVPVPVLTSPSPSPLRTVAAGFSPATCDLPAPSGLPVTPQRAAARGVKGWSLLGGWSYFTDGSGFHMPVPDGWTYQRIGTTFCFRDPVGTRVMALSLDRDPAGDPVKACRTEAQRLVRSGALPGYQQITLERKELLNKAADWEYTYVADGAQRHVRTRWLATDGKAYAISWATREFDWTADLPKVNMVLSTFYADRPAGS
ncbi:serine/threonine-protein kinase [Paractinoplanes atraurantiacus]|uniref:non-specific serine/threonine protein kinase n=1 Tax=Paractinoplanes atraurantiacus TaxID=1036182 RepID=A0A285FW20_9ACTN|nr:serine/threonine-protein kinase [Actinoplanes atraurantiacus]SNY14994.1 Serine/threonine protein kinase [Actinoplanes atraurantiacus]